MHRTISHIRPAAASRLDRLIAETSARLEAGESVDLAALTADCPELREQLEMLLPTLQAVATFDECFPSADPSAHQEKKPHSDNPAPASSLQSPASSPGLLGDFHILRELGRGGMGIVYEAEQLSLGRRVALKVLPFAAMLDRQQLARFKNEARAAATLDHPNIVAIHSVGVERGVHYYAMQLIEGQSLAQALNQLRAKAPKPKSHTPKQGRAPQPDAPTALFERTPSLNNPKSESEDSSQPPVSDLQSPASSLQSSLPAYSSRDYYRTIARLGIQAAEALDHAHQNGILHRDVKPANLLVDDAGKLWITDFGLARIEQDAGMTMTGDLVGTLRYMSPEQALAKRVVVDHRSDVYALGATLYELLTLQPAYSADDRQDLLRQLAFEEPPKPRHIKPHIPQDLETIVLKAVEKNPADR